jgi:hypothetical protein
MSMDKVICNVRMYANDVAERLISLRDRNRDNLSARDIDTLNDAANLIYKNIGKLTET